MALYKYTARAVDGKIVNGTMQANDKQELFVKLQKDNNYLMDYTEVKENVVVKGGTKLKTKDLTFFCRQMQAMLVAGITVVKALDLIYQKTDNPKLKKVYMDLFETVQKGSSLSEAMEKQGRTFPSLLINMVYYGETGGNLDMVMTQMADHYIKEGKTKNQVKSAMMYPMILGVVTILIVGLLMIFVVPMLTKNLDDSDLPLISKIVFGISDFCIKFWWLIIAIVVVLIIAFKALGRTEGFTKWKDKVKVKAPIIGKLQKTVLTTRFSRTLASLYKSGVPLIEGIATAARTLGNTYVVTLFDSVIEDLKRGTSMYVALSKMNFFDSMFLSMVYVGEESGGLDGVLERTAAFFDDEAESATKRMVTLLEPVILVVMAVIIGSVIVAIIMPMYGGMKAE